MGRGLAAILPERRAARPASCASSRSSLIKPNPRQPRTHFDAEALAALAESIAAQRRAAAARGPRPCAGGSYELVAGERRWRAAQLAGLETCRRSCATRPTRSGSSSR